MTAPDLLLCVLCMATCGRLIFYRRSGCQFKRHFSVVAYLLVVLTGSIALALLTGRLSAANLPPLLLVPIGALCGMVYYVRGNVAQLLRLLTPTKKHPRTQRWN